MGEQIQITAEDGFQFDAYRAMPDDEPAGAIVVVQEIFGVNQHIREVSDGFAAEGYVAIAPAIFDRAERGVELGYEPDDMTRGIEIVSRELDHNAIMFDLQASIDEARQFGKVGVVGYCFGGTMAWLCACRARGLACAVGYYGGQIAQNAALTPQVPVMLHFGELDAHIPMDDVNRIKEAHPDIPVYVYKADHGFNCDHRASYDEAASKEARDRTLDFFSTNLA
ncbi:MAG: dienelactone hydrolase family protein [Pseudomonadales bacterium]|nr:dienelactone hydrolase family protein [Pseudomonadales bacterium]